MAGLPGPSAPGGSSLRAFEVTGRVRRIRRTERCSGRDASTVRLVRGGTRSAAAAERDAVRAKRHLAGGTFIDDAALRSRMTWGTCQKALRTRFTKRVAVVVEAREGTAAPGTTRARPIGAHAIAARVVAFALNVTRRGIAGEGARAAFRAQTFAVGARARTIGPLLTRHVAGRAVAGELAVAAGSTFAIPVATGRFALGIVAFAERVARRRVADQLARASFRAHALAPVALRSAVAGRRRQRCDECQEQPQPDALHARDCRLLGRCPSPHGTRSPWRKSQGR